MDFPDRWVSPTPPQVQLSGGGTYEISGEVNKQGTVTVTVTLVGDTPYAFAEDEGQALGSLLRGC